MKTILVIAGHSPETEHAAAFALMIAQVVQADVLIANTVKLNQLESGQAVVVAAGQEQIEEQAATIKELLESKIDPDGAYIPVISEMDISDVDVPGLIAIINRRDIWMLAEGMPDTFSKAAGHLTLNIQSVLNRVGCPLLLIPQSWKLKNLERIVYLADLRYCRQQVLKYLAGLAAPFNAGISVAHLTARGLVDIADAYAAILFRDEIMPNVHYEKITFNNTRERNLHKAVDVIINGLHNDLMVLVNHRYHFEEIIGSYIGEVMPAEITIPMLIFPL